MGFKEIAALADLFGLHEFEAREVISRRLKEGKRVSLREVLYPLMQGYDSVAVKADIEIGGTDQRFNLLAGRTIQAHYGMARQDIIMTDLLEGTDGKKMSSSAGNVINITDQPEDMFGKVMAIPDTLVEKYFMFATNLERDTVREIMRRPAVEAKERLALEITKIYHGEKGAGVAGDFFKKTFRERKLPENILEVEFSDAKLSDILLKAGLVSSTSEFRRLIRSGAIEADQKTVPDPNFKPSPGVTIRVGKKKFLKISAK